jgi:putative hydrolase of the HAD superfamily
MQAVIFDYGMVLCERDPETYRRLLALAGVDHDTFERLYWRDRHQYDLGRIEAVDWWANFARDAGRSFAPAEVATLIESDVLLWTRLSRPMVAWAAALQSAGLRTAILSNMGPDLLRFMRRSPDYAWLSGFTHLTWSCELHIAKPDPAIYLHTCEHLGVAPADTLFIDDKPENIAAAEALGMRAIHFTDVARLRRDLAARQLLDGYPQPELPGAPPEGVEQFTASLE